MRIALLALISILFLSCQNMRTPPEPKEAEAKAKQGEGEVGRFQLFSARVAKGGKGIAVYDENTLFRIDTKTGIVWEYWEYSGDKGVSRKWFLTDSTSLIDPLGLFSEDERDSIYHALRESTYTVGKYKVSVPRAKK